MKLRSLELVNHDHSASYACKSVTSSILFGDSSSNAHEINIDDEDFSFFFETVSYLDLHHLISEEKDYAVLKSAPQPSRRSQNMSRKYNEYIPYDCQSVHMIITK